MGYVTTEILIYNGNIAICHLRLHIVRYDY